ncbi:MAG: winged helix-turn-helix transcriptional regulator [Muribaculaceae bacterium]|nr:winged helix-turn-helix transcriptional regulator [Muribaculaceae bacterium]
MENAPTFVQKNVENVRKEDKGEYIQSLVDSRESEDSTLAQDVMLRHHIANLNLRALQYQQQDGGASEANVGENVGVNVGVKLTDTQKNVFELIKANPAITHPEMARTLSLSIKTIERATKALREYGLLEREGSAKSGSWVVLP